MMISLEFLAHSPSAVGGMKVDWEADVERTHEVRAALKDCDAMRAGILMRGFVIGTVTYPRGTLVFRVGEGHELFLQLPPDLRAVEVPKLIVEPTWTVDHVDGIERHRGIVGTVDADERIDILIAARAPNISRAKAKRLLDDGCVSVAGQSIRKSNQRLRAGDVIELVVVGPSQG